ncbi:hypothetical protein Efla_001382 [Eimeria flavescens]
MSSREQVTEVAPVRGRLPGRYAAEIAKAYTGVWEVDACGSTETRTGALVQRVDVRASSAQAEIAVGARHTSLPPTLESCVGRSVERRRRSRGFRYVLEVTSLNYSRRASGIKRHPARRGSALTLARNGLGAGGADAGASCSIVWALGR